MTKNEEAITTWMATSKKYCQKCLIYQKLFIWNARSFFIWMAFGAFFNWFTVCLRFSTRLTKLFMDMHDINFFCLYLFVCWQYPQIWFPSNFSYLWIENIFTECAVHFTIYAINIRRTKSKVVICSVWARG